MGYIYKITNIINNKCYIGQTTRTIEERYEEHLAHARRHENRYLYDAMNHYGYDNFTVEMLEEAPLAQLNDLEIHYITTYKASNPNFGYNMTGGGSNRIEGLPPEVEKRRTEKISKALTGKSQSPELVAKRVEKLTGQKRTLEHKQKFSIAQKKRFANSAGTMCGKNQSDEAKQRLREANLGKKQSEETKRKRSESMGNLKWWNNGTECVRAVECPQGYTAGRINFKPSNESKAKSSHKGTKWYTNGKENRMAYECPEGFWPGKTFKKDVIK